MLVRLSDGSNCAQQQGEADREHTLFAAREWGAAEVEGGKGSFVDFGFAEKFGDEADFFELFRGGSDGFAELAEGEHSGRLVSHGADDGGVWLKIDLARLHGLKQNPSIETIQITG